MSLDPTGCEENPRLLIEKVSSCSCAIKVIMTFPFSSNAVNFSWETYILTIPGSWVPNFGTQSNTRPKWFLRKKNVYSCGHSTRSLCSEDLKLGLPISFRTEKRRNPISSIVWGEWSLHVSSTMLSSSSSRTSFKMVSCVFTDIKVSDCSKSTWNWITVQFYDMYDFMTAHCGPRTQR